MARPWIAIPVNQKKAYLSLCIIKYFLDIISPNNDMKAKIDALFAEYPAIDTAAMGFPGGKVNRCGNEADFNSKAGEDGNSASSPDLIRMYVPRNKPQK